MVIEHTIQSRPTLLVTGVGGLVGGRLAAVAGGHFHLIGLSRREGTDIAVRDQVERAFDRAAQAAGASAPAAVIHLAAYTDVSRAHSQAGDKEGPCYLTNVVGSENIARACAARRIHMIHVSTDFVFDGTKNGPYEETDLPSPIEWYGRTKWLAEEAVRRTAHLWTVARIAFPYSPEPGPKPDLVRGILDKLLAGGEVNLFDDQIITPTFADDVARGLLLIARVRPERELFHLAGTGWVTPFDAGLKIASAFRLDAGRVMAGSLAEYLKKDTRPRQTRLRISNTKWSAFALRHGLAPPLNFDEGLQRVRLAWSKSHGEGGAGLGGKSGRPPSA